jgi:nucleotide-binding universal stress UspA family protein
MTGRIVIGIDGSQQSRNALEWAVARARLGGQQLELVNAYSFTPAVDFYGYHGLAASQQSEPRLPAGDPSPRSRRPPTPSCPGSR